MSGSKAKKPVVVSILNLKGGVGKTTVAALLARYASGTGGPNMEGQKDLDVLAVDLDPQANLSQALMGDESYDNFMAKTRAKDSTELSIVDLFKSPGRITAESVVRQTAGNPAVVPSVFSFSQVLIESWKPDETVLDEFLRREAAGKDLVIIDCAPTESAMTRAAYYASDYVIIPVRPEFFAVIGFPLMIESLAEFNDKRPGRNIKVCVLVNNSRSRGLPEGPHHRNSMKNIIDEAIRNEWPILYNQLWDGRGYPKWVKDPNVSIRDLGNIVEDWPPVANEICQLIGLSDEMVAEDYANVMKERDDNYAQIPGWDRIVLQVREIMLHLLDAGEDDEWFSHPAKLARRNALQSFKEIAESLDLQWNKSVRIQKIIGAALAEIEIEQNKRRKP